jgi:carbonic anhydrase/acetyltransferase-like protein (isoleucine patch superfamily)
VAAGSLVPQGKVVPAGWLVMGVPAKPVRKMDAAEIDDIKRNAVEYFELWQRDYRYGPQGAPGSTPRPPNSPPSGKPSVSP